MLAMSQSSSQYTAIKDDEVALLVMIHCADQFDFRSFRRLSTQYPLLPAMLVRASVSDLTGVIDDCPDIRPEEPAPVHSPRKMFQDDEPLGRKAGFDFPQRFAASCIHASKLYVELSVFATAKDCRSTDGIRVAPAIKFPKKLVCSLIRPQNRPLNPRGDRDRLFQERRELCAETLRLILQESQAFRRP